MRQLKNILLILLIALAGFGLFSIYAKYSAFGKSTTIEDSEVLLEQIQTVMKLVTVQGTFSEIYNYKNYVVTDAWPFRKSALIRVNALVSVGYDLEEMSIDVDEENKIIKITNFPDAKIISVEHDLQYYDMKQGLFNVITTDDVTEMSQQAKKFIEEKAVKSELFAKVEEQRRETEKLLSFMFVKSGWQLEVDDPVLLN